MCAAPGSYERPSIRFSQAVPLGTGTKETCCILLYSPSTTRPRWRRTGLPMDNTLVIKARSLIDGSGAPPVSDPCVVIQGDRITGVYHGRIPDQILSQNVESYDFPDVTLLPGLIDCHVHLTLPADGTTGENIAQESVGIMAMLAARNARQALMAGITTVRDCGSRSSAVFDLRRAGALGLIESPRLVLCGHQLTPPGGHGWQIGKQVQGIDDLVSAVKELASIGVDFIKIMGSGGGTGGTRPWLPTYSQDELSAVTDAAHALDLKVAVHSLSAAATKLAVAAGADIVEHAGFTVDEAGNQRYEPEVAAMVADAGVVITPTLSTRYHTVRALCAQQTLPADKVVELERWRRMQKAQLEQVGMLHKAGVKIIAGTDAGWRYTPFDALIDEIELLHQSGLSRHEALCAATGRAAEAFGMNSVFGFVQSGNAADLLGVIGDPLKDLHCLRQLKFVIKAGTWVVRPKCGIPAAN